MKCLKRKHKRTKSKLDFVQTQFCELINLVNQQPDIDKIYLYAKVPY